MGQKVGTCCRCSALVAVACLLAYRLDILALGDEVAERLGRECDRTARVVADDVCGAGGACVAVVGSSGFVGLLAPHMARRLVGGKHIWLFL